MDPCGSFSRSSTVPSANFLTALRLLIISAVGYVTGNQERQNEGNIENEKVSFDGSGAS